LKPVSASSYLNKNGCPGWDLRQILTAWPELSPELRTAVLAVTRAAKRIHDNS
jgi:hypothetical protein